MAIEMNSKENFIAKKVEMKGFDANVSHGSYFEVNLSLCDVLKSLYASKTRNKNNNQMVI